MSILSITDQRVYEYLKVQASVKKWIELVLGEKLDEDLRSSLKDGCVLCQVMMKIDHNSIPRVQRNTKVEFKLKENIFFFLEACKEVGVPPYKLFQISDLLSQLGNIVRVVECVATLAAIVEKKGVTALPSIDIPTLPDGKKMAELKYMIAQLREPPKGLKIPVSSDIVRRRLHYMIGNSDAVNMCVKGIVRFQALFHGYKVRQMHKKMVRDVAYRDKVAKEILKTEQDYVHNLDVCIKVYLLTIQEKLDKPRSYMTKENIKVIFSDIEIIHAFNKNLLQGLQQRVQNWSPHQKLGDIFLEIVGFLKVYTNYVQNFDKSIVTLETLRKKEKFRELVEKCRNCPDTKSLDLSAFLIMPVQRIPRYNLLLQDLVKHTWEDHCDFENLSKAVVKVKEVALSINEKKRDAEEMSLTFEMHTCIEGKHELSITPHRRFIKEGVLFDIKNDKECAVFLFNDIVVFGKPLSSPKATLKRRIRFSTSLQVTQSDINEHPDLKTHKFCFRIKDVVFAAKSEEEKAEWLAVTKKVQAEIKEHRNLSNSHDGHNGNHNHSAANDQPSPPISNNNSLDDLQQPISDSAEKTELFISKNIILQQLAAVTNCQKKSDSKQTEKGLIALREKLTSELESIEKRLLELDGGSRNTTPRGDRAERGDRADRAERGDRADRAVKKGDTFTRSLFKSFVGNLAGGEALLADSALFFDIDLKVPKKLGSESSMKLEPLVEGTMTLADLQLKAWRITTGNVEAYLSDDEFMKAFKVSSRQDFYNQPKWKQDQQKKELKLF